MPHKLSRLFRYETTQTALAGLKRITNVFTLRHNGKAGRPPTRPEEAQPSGPAFPSYVMEAPAPEYYMDVLEIYGFDSAGWPFLLGDVGNDWQAVPAILLFMEEKYLPLYRPRHVPPQIPDSGLEKYLGYKPTRVADWNNPAVQEIFDLIRRKDVPTEERIALITVSRPEAVVFKKDFDRLIEFFNKFPGESSLKEQAALIAAKREEKGCLAIGWHQTQDGLPWWLYHHGNLDPYNIKTMSGRHADVFAFFDDCNKAE